MAIHSPAARAQTAAANIADRRHNISKLIAHREPRLRADIDVFADKGTRRIFRGDGCLFSMNSPGIDALLPLLDGHHNLGALCGALKGTMNPTQVALTLRKLEALDALREGPSIYDEVKTPLLDALNAKRDISEIDLICLGPENEGEWADMAKTAFGVTATATSRQAPPTAPLVVITDSYLNLNLRNVNHDQLLNNKPWILMQAAGSEIWIGPLFKPGETACWQCLAYRLDGHQALDHYLTLTGDHKVRAANIQASSPTSRTLAMSMVLSALTMGNQNDLTTFDLRSNSTTKHPVTRRPQCPACGDTPQEIALSRRASSLTSVHRARQTDGRVRSLAETRQAIDPHISPYTGIVTSIQEIDTGTDLFYAYAAGHDFAMSSSRFDTLVKALRGSLSGGKGRTRERAEVSALCEAIERGLTVFRGDERRERGSYTQMADRALDIDTLLQFSRNQYDTREVLLSTSDSKYEYVPHKFDPRWMIDWTEVQPVLGGETRLVPTSYCYYGHPELYKYGYCLADSNGTAAGGCLEEAIVHGFCELVERDSVGIWWYNRLRRPAVDFAAVNDAYLQQVIAFHADLQRTIWALDLTTDTRVPCFALISAALDRPAGAPEDIIISFGCALDPMRAWESALDELNQFIPFVLPNAEGKATYWGADAETREWLTRATLERDFYLRPDPSLPATRLDAVASLATGNITEDVRLAAKISERLGSQMYTLDLSRPEVDLAVARVIVPGLRHFWRRTGPGRLYDVPVKMGWLDAPTPEMDLNPTTVFF